MSLSQRGKPDSGTLVALGALSIAAVAVLMAGMFAGDRYPAFLDSAASELKSNSLYLPLGIFGLFRWGIWLSKKIPAAFYRPISAPYTATCTIVTPVYQEDPVIFRKAIESWRRNKPTEIIAVIDVTDTTCIGIAREYPDVTVVVTAKPGKRAALTDGILAATTEIVFLVDSDVIFEPHVIERTLMPFADPKIGGVGTRQKVYDRSTVWQRIADMFLDVRYEDEAPALTRVGQALSCLSGRTAAYRRDVLLPLLDDFMSETFLGRPCMSGDDKRLTTLVLKAGYNTYHQGNALVWSTFPPDFGTFLKQRIRWTRNSYRSDLRAMWEGWVWKRHYLAFNLVDKSISPYTLLMGLTFFVIALTKSEWILASIIVTWWLVSRTVKMLPHFMIHPSDLLLLPMFIGVTFMMTFVKAYSLTTVHQHKWLTRQVEVVEGEVVRSGSAAAAKANTTPLLARSVGSALLVAIVSFVQLAAYAIHRMVGP